MGIWLSKLWRLISRQWCKIGTWYQWMTSRKRPSVVPMVTLPMTSRDPRCRTRVAVKEWRVKCKASGAMGQIPRSIERISSYLLISVRKPDIPLISSAAQFNPSGMALLSLHFICSTINLLFLITNLTNFSQNSSWAHFSSTMCWRKSIPPIYQW